MATCLYVNSDPETVAKGNALGCGWVPDVPDAYTGVAIAPCVILSGAGETVVLRDDATLTLAAVNAALGPILAAEQAAAAAATAQASNDAATSSALNTAMARLTQIIGQGNTLAGQSTAWTVAQQKAVAQAIADLALFERQLIRRAIGLFDGSN